MDQSFLSPHWLSPPTTILAAPSPIYCRKIPHSHIIYAANLPIYPPPPPEMKDDDHPTSTATITAKKDGPPAAADSALFGRGRYKFWALAAILLLAFWSMFTGTVTLKWSAGNLNRLSDDIDVPIHDDLDVLVRASPPLYPEIEEREKVVKHMWDVYINSRRIRLPRFWQEAFEAAYEELASDAPGVREAAISEIAKMSMRTIDLEPPPRKSTISPLFVFPDLGMFADSPIGAFLVVRNYFFDPGLPYKDSTAVLDFRGFEISFLPMLDKVDNA
ncbi:hypothetical protein ACLOJK_002839 [Asimina triloba]